MNIASGATPGGSGTKIGGAVNLIGMPEPGNSIGTFIVGSSPEFTFVPVPFAPFLCLAGSSLMFRRRRGVEDAMTAATDSGS